MALAWIMLTSQARCNFYEKPNSTDIAVVDKMSCISC